MRQIPRHISTSFTKSSWKGGGTLFLVDLLPNANAIHIHNTIEVWYTWSPSDSIAGQALKHVILLWDWRVFKSLQCSVNTMTANVRRNDWLMGILRQHTRKSSIRKSQPEESQGHEKFGPWWGNVNTRSKCMLLAHRYCIYSKEWLVSGNTWAA